MAYNISEWRATKQFTDKLPEVLGVSENDVTPKGYIYFDERGRVFGFIEEIGPTFYSALIGDDREYRHADEGLKELEQLVYDQLLSQTV